jgi:hypothetical protein
VLIDVVGAHGGARDGRMEPHHFPAKIALWLLVTTIRRQRPAELPAPATRDGPRDCERDHPAPSSGWQRTYQAPRRPGAHAALQASSALTAGPHHQERSQLSFRDGFARGLSRLTTTAEIAVPGRTSQSCDERTSRDVMSTAIRQGHGIAGRFGPVSRCGVSSPITDWELHQYSTSEQRNRHETIHSRIDPRSRYHRVSG